MFGIPRSKLATVNSYLLLILRLLIIQEQGCEGPVTDISLLMTLTMATGRASLCFHLSSVVPGFHQQQSPVGTRRLGPAGSFTGPIELFIKPAASASSLGLADHDCSCLPGAGSPRASQPRLVLPTPLLNQTCSSSLLHKIHSTFLQSLLA
jgi:hypothetical protein